MKYNINVKIAVGTNHVFKIVSPDKIKDISLKNTNIIVNHRGYSYPLYTGSTPDDLQKLIKFSQRMVPTMENKINDEVLDYIAEHNSDPLDFMYAIMSEADLTDEEALEYLMESFGYKSDEDKLKEVIAQYHRENN